MYSLGRREIVAPGGGGARWRGFWGRFNVAPEPAAYLTAQQVAKLLQIHPATVYRMAASDPSMPALKLGGVVRFPRERLLRWLQDREQGRSYSGQRIKRQVLSAPNPAPSKDAA